ncbi:hypothetical protein NEF87_000777 [Candidatus Lokiarchaeum ossiferum]|uniref:DUF3326 domain-containing protein n=1 Tax=Candidatus Lokiarchaeum ossiferum TaxID=2951803 RepID=A0ABY6HLV6_9ARCH|nr:hypothetical protein NEF87_000777 [Candidatus Lokiarchaeum sp. B-35]
MNIVMIIPTGIGCEIGGHCGDGQVAARLLGQCCDTLVLHPNVVNASDLNEMPHNSLYVEGSQLDMFLQGKTYLQKVHSNKILVVVNKADYQSINAVSAARISLGINAEILELKTPLKMFAKFENQIATGDVEGWEELVEQVLPLEFDALAIATPITVDKDTMTKYFETGGVNPVGGVEAKASKLIARKIGKPVAHGPVDYALNELKEIVDPRIAVETITENFIHCILKGLHKAPRLNAKKGLSIDDIDCMVSPYGCFGPPHEACLKAGIPIIVVKENRSVLNIPEHDKFIYVENYLEAAGLIMAMRAGIEPSTIRRPIPPTVVRK